MANPTPQQKAAIEKKGRIIVSASAGSGKTFVMIERLADYVENGGDLDSWEMDFDEDFTVPQQNTEGKKQIHIDGGTGEIALTFAGNTEKGATA